MWDRMETFYYVVKAGSFTKAEQVLNKSQSALSRSIMILEEQLGHRLLKRKIKGLELTRKGEEVFRTAQRMLMDMQSMQTNLHEKKTMTGKIRICTTYAVANYLLADPIFAFKKKHPDISFEVYCNDQLIDIVQNEVDVAIRPYEPDNNEVIQEYLLTLQANLYASSKYIETYGEPKSIKELSQHKFIAFSRPQILPYADLEWFLKFGGSKNKLKDADIFRVNSVEMHFQAAKEGLGIIASYDQMSITKQSDLIKILPDFKGPKYEDHFVYPKRLQDVEKIKVLKSFLMEKFKHMRD
jgi:DNA-binding transcriptional LysR family regulator